MAAVANEITRTLLKQITRGELLTKTLGMFEEKGEKIKISSPNFESVVKKVLVENYDIKEDDLIPSSKDNLDNFVNIFVITVRKHIKNPSVKGSSKRLLNHKPFSTYYEYKINASSDLGIRYSKKRKSSEMVPGTSRPEKVQSPLAKRIRLQRYFNFQKFVIHSKDLFDWRHNLSHSTLYPDVLKIITIIVVNFF